LLSEQGTLQAFLLAGERGAASWMLDWLQQGHPAAGQSRWLLAGGARPPGAETEGGHGADDARRTVCSCNDVSGAQIDAAAAGCAGLPSDERLRVVQAATRCGTTCGSCLPALKARLAAQPGASTTSARPTVEESIP
jgi:assimilatory nitrate reductase catalytic subunit